MKADKDLDTSNKVSVLKQTRYIIKLLFGNYLFTPIVTIPMVLATCYYLCMASPIYESSAIIVFHQSGNQSMPSDFSLSLLLGSRSSNTFNQELYTRYLTSYDMFSRLNKKIDLIKMFQSDKIDWFSRLTSNNPNQEDIKDYYKDMVRASSSGSGGIKISAKAFTPEDSFKIVNELINQSQKYVNQVNRNLIMSQMNFNKELLKEAKEKILIAERKVLAFQNKYKMLDPNGLIQIEMQILSGLMTNLAQEEITFQIMLAKRDSNSSQVRSQKHLLEGIKKQIIAEKAKILDMTENYVDGQDSKPSEVRSQKYLLEEFKKPIVAEKTKILGMTGNDVDDRTLNYYISRFKLLKMDVEYAAKVYSNLMQSYEANRISLSKDQVQLVVIEPPITPDYAEFPRKAYILSSLGIILLMIFGIVKMLITIINEHRY